MLGLSLLSAESYSQQKAHQPADKKWSSGHPDKKMQGQTKDFSSQSEGLLSQSYLGHRYDQNQDQSLGLVLSCSGPGLVHQRNHWVYSGESINRRVDVYASFGFAKVYTDKMVVRAIDLLKTKVLPIYRQFNLPLDRILIDNGKALYYSLA